MVTLVKHEWHSVDSQFAFELTVDVLEEIYPDLKRKELKKILREIEEGDYDIETLINDAWENDVEIEWDRQYDDWWTDRKGGYEVTYELGDESSWHHEPPPPEPTHKCSKCKFTGQGYDFDYNWGENGEDEPTKTCPYCDSPAVLTEAGVQKEKEMEEMRKQWAEEEEEE